ncbi:unnamed protein product (macronuclear) [Paramecium tetraurelia]|uniref:Uncharacterized protein n=1 Tax=Paramecium tetraurelia TaxID=5888 RepID=A0E1V3_PARTE|nr:uncharacterized protein GSPATT00022441001 [Paramecium tetraurelia]CAK89270.1 unnamed protein product [Paramecium tetraurelia]|eukprot:XP_001456667.1 hypothetical protein (macronuclear) [Paramecium tetraurelia strain d4-2]
MLISQHIYDYEIILKNQSYVALNNPNKQIKCIILTFSKEVMGISESLQDDKQIGDHESQVNSNSEKMFTQLNYLKNKKKNKLF